MSSVQWLLAIWKVNQNIYKFKKLRDFMKSIHLIVSGKVQGVFFRYNTRKKAEELVLKGYAKNLKDGTVEVVAEGKEEKISELIEFIKKGPGIARVSKVKIRNKELENFNGFEVRP